MHRPAIVALLATSAVIILVFVISLMTGYSDPCTDNYSYDTERRVCMLNFIRADD